MKSKVVVIMILFWFLGLLLIAGTISGSGAFINSAYAQKQQPQQSFIAKLSGNNESPPINTQATGMAKFTVNSNDTVSYELDANNINAVIGARISQNNGSLLAEIFNPYAIHNGKSGIPTGQINGVLSSGSLTSADLSGPLAGKKVSDFVNLMKQGKSFVEVRTLQHQKGEIRGQILISTRPVAGITIPQASQQNAASASGAITNITSTLTTPSPLSQQQQCAATTEPTIQGPEYKARPPLRQGQDFAKGLQGPRLELTGRVLSAMGCKPVQGAVLDIWQADVNGNYDNKGYNLRGRITTDKDGRYVLDTIYPGRLHMGNTILRPSHVHVMVGIPGQPILTTQIYFENQPRDAAVKDPLITKTVTDVKGTKIANFDFVIEDYRGANLSMFDANNNNSTRPAS
jgi:protocatechuate 3,4-dioxygenase beta subunit